jgi:hypothetical protein
MWNKIKSLLFLPLIFIVMSGFVYFIKALEMQTNTNKVMSAIKIEIGSRKFSATLFDNATTQALKSRFPLKLDMVELNANEKYADLSVSLPAKASNPGIIKAGDIMLYGASTLVIFYETFNTRYAYTRIGRIENTAGLKEALGSGDVAVTFSMD